RHGGGGRAVAPGAPVAVPDHHALAGQPVEDGHHRRVGELAVGQRVGHLAYGRAVGGVGRGVPRPQHLHHRAFQLTRPRIVAVATTVRRSTFSGRPHTLRSRSSPFWARAGDPVSAPAVTSPLAGEPHLLRRPPARPLERNLLRYV